MAQVQSTTSALLAFKDRANHSSRQLRIRIDACSSALKSFELKQTIYVAALEDEEETEENREDIQEMIASANNAIDDAEVQFDQLEKPQPEDDQVRANLKRNEMENVEFAIKEMVKCLEEL